MHRCFALLTIAILFFFCTAFANAEKAASTKYVEVKSLDLKPVFKTKSDWHITALQSTESKNDPTAGAASKVCLWTDKSKKDKSCSILESANEFDPTSTYPHQTVSRLDIVKLNKSQQGIFLTAEFSGGGSGLLVRNQLWTYASEQDKFDETMRFNLTEQGESRFISSGPLEGDLITADAYWEFGESHFEPHRFSIEVFKYRNAGGVTTYSKILTYITAKKYPSLDAGKINAITPELPSIISKLKSVYGPKLSPW